MNLTPVKPNAVDDSLWDEFLKYLAWVQDPKSNPPGGNGRCLGHPSDICFCPYPAEKRYNLPSCRTTGGTPVPLCKTHARLIRKATGISRRTCIKGA
ncbi:hypothetical protein A3K34_01080 [candidate division WWE3 bacterium RIFOXYC1_FULL_40_10]|uniref:Uncharacterized protein n=1 Tax=candidate division WWE3 bacterium RIFOXYA2_FULL_46_9 TaxID=1802636 RepID=A0A1F4W1V6_UNCKA|nr:MAG: hypothetical protein A3K58_01080 [candidate division WWE3 bacterium RIFOXYB1_FULL_40_22]OGC61462.1 MAG: hypothetical protein A3K37_01080 [candidate division WWE3 bacterium RIFOXYA1_FULL_40_11]OGC63396.1 MAG: hypothetical protein A2264_01555 [candidate division WWE3 bacterium RIFOXYA2_FULL_46_9]OGC64574.1 MAG: hypothetical protein A2326_03680 [candidate division WWE3 bacterium RIFOXYB2_FULL_41_6]OGC65845.1 MAG: hypothetical protein A3K34_01080 [candidate division WWE3 bacterium RIFOXYC1_